MNTNMNMIMKINKIK